MAKNRREVNVPEHPFPFPELRPYQRAILDEIEKSGKPLPRYFFPRIRQTGTRFVGIDLAQKGGDKTVIVQGVPDGRGGIQIIAMDEYSGWPNYKWWRNPIQWLRWRKTMKLLSSNHRRKK